MSAREQILMQIRRQRLPAAALPELPSEGICYADRELQFCEVLRSVGGEAIVAAGASGVRAKIQELPCMQQASKILSLVDAAGTGNVDLATIDDPHQLADVDVAIAPGEFAVAENGAVWVNGQAVPHRAILFLTQHLVLVVPRNEIVDHMHKAYEQLRFEKAGYGVFISGPSKTADIEQSLVIGAHGARSLTVVLVE